jgi:hypothetical protein
MRNTSRSVLTAALVMVMLAAVVLLLQLQHETLAAPPETPAERRVIAPGSCYATFEGSGCKTLIRNPDEPHGYDLAQLLRDHKGGPSNVILVRGNDIAAAVRATRFAFTGGRSADTPVPQYNDGRQGEGESLWLVAYLGTSSSTPIWRVNSAEVRDCVARLTYSRLRPRQVTTDSWHYFVWVPLGQPKAGGHIVELYEADLREVVLTRRVFVEKP